MKRFTKVMLSIVCLSGVGAVMASSADAFEKARLSLSPSENKIEQLYAVPTLPEAPKKVNRAKVVNIVVELELPDGSRITVDNIDFCTPGGFYHGVEALVFGDEAVRVMQAGMAALYPKVGDSINQAWENKVNPDDPRLPTYLMIKTPENKLNKPKLDMNLQGVAKTRQIETFRSSAKLMNYGASTPSILATCGGYNHPD